MGERRPGRRGAGPGPEAWGAVGEESTRSGRAEVRADIRRTEREPRPGRAAGRGGRRRAPRVSRGSEAPRGGADPTPERRHGGPPPRRHVPRRGEGTVREAARRPGTTGAEGDGRGARAPPPKPSTRPPRGRRGGDRGQGAPRGGGGHGSSGGPGRGRWGAEPGRDNKGVGRDRLKGGEDGHRAQPLPRRCTTPPFLRATAARSATPRAAVAALPRASGRPLPLFSLSPAHTRFFSRPSRPAGRHRAGPPAPHG